MALLSNTGPQAAPVAQTQLAAKPLDKKPMGTGFTNINRVLEANKQNKLGSTIAGNIKQQAGDVKTGIQQQAQQFGTQAEANRLDTGVNQELRGKTLEGITGQSGFQDPDAKTIEAFQTMQAGQYKGPTGLDEQQTAQLKRQGQDVGQLGQLTGTGSGRQTLLQRIVGNPGYNAGQQKMDTLLLGQSGKDLNQVRRDTKGLTNQLGVEQQKATNLAQQYQRGNEEFGRTTREMVGGALTGQTEAQKAAYDKTIADAQAQFGGLYKGLQGVDATTDVSKRTQLTPEQFKNMGIDTSTEEGANKAAVLNSLFSLSNRESADQVKLNVADKYNILNNLPQQNDGTPEQFRQVKTKEEALADIKANEQAYRDYDTRQGLDMSKWTPEQSLARAAMYNQYTVKNGAGNFSDYTQGQRVSDDLLKQMGLTGKDVNIGSISKKQNENVDWENLLSSNVLSTTKDAQGNLVYTPTKTMTELSNADQLRKINALRQLGTDKATPLYSQEEIAGAGKTSLNPTFDYERAKGRIQGVNVTPDMKLDLSSPEATNYAQMLGDYGNKYGQTMANISTLGLAKDTPLADVAGVLGSVIPTIGGGAINLVQDPISSAAGTVICTELYLQGLMSEDIYRKDVVFGQNQSPMVIKGYHRWAKPLVKLMKKSPIVTKIVNVFAKPWSKEMAYGNNKVGKVLMFIGLPICRVIGWF